MGGKQARDQELEVVDALLLVVQQDGGREAGFQVGACDWRREGGREGGREGRGEDYVVLVCA